MAELAATQRHLSGLQARWWALLAEAERRGATVALAGLPTAAWLVDRNTHSARTARQEVRLAVQLDAQPVVAQALGQGVLSAEQARTITVGLDRLPADLDDGQRQQVADEGQPLQGKHKLIHMLESLAERLEARVQG